MIREILLGSLLCLIAGGCGSTRVRVLDEVTGEPIARVRVRPVVGGMFGPSFTDAVVTDERGEATIGFPKRKLYWQLNLEHPAYREFYPEGKPWSEGEVALRYMRRRPRVVLLLPADFAGPVLVSSARDYDPTLSVHRVALSADPLRPTGLAARDWNLVRLDEVEGERGGVIVTPGPEAPAAGAIHVWLPKRSSFLYEGGDVSLLFVGTKGQLKVFERELERSLRRRGGRERGPGSGDFGRSSLAGIASEEFDRELARLSRSLILIEEAWGGSCAPGGGAIEARWR